MPGHRGAVTSAAFLDAGRLATGGEDGTVRLWEVGAVKPSSILRHDAPVRQIAVAPDGRLASACDDGTIHLWDVTQAWNVDGVVAIGRIELDRRQRVAIAFGSDGDTIASASAEGAVRLYRLQIREQRREIVLDSARHQFVPALQSPLTLSLADGRHYRLSPRAERLGSVLVAGTGSYQLLAAERMVSEQIGRLLAESGYQLVGGGWPGVDHIVAREFVERSGPAEGRACLVQCVVKEPDFRGGTTLLVDPNDQYAPLLVYADAVVLIGGRGGTAEIGRRAADFPLPVLPVAGAGGDAALIYGQLGGPLSRRWFDRGCARLLGQEIGDEADARRVAVGIMQILDLLLDEDARNAYSELAAALITAIIRADSEIKSRLAADSKVAEYMAELIDIKAPDYLPTPGGALTAGVVANLAQALDSLSDGRPFADVLLDEPAANIRWWVHHLRRLSELHLVWSPAVAVQAEKLAALTNVADFPGRGAIEAAIEGALSELSETDVGELSAANARLTEGARQELSLLVDKSLRLGRERALFARLLMFAAAYLGPTRIEEWGRFGAIFMASPESSSYFSGKTAPGPKQSQSRGGGFDLRGRRGGGARRNCSAYWRTRAAAGPIRMPTSPLALIKAPSAAIRRTTSSAVSGHLGPWRAKCLRLWRCCKLWHD
jgi:hypothetical protein